jgi:hypothetical protein
MMEEKQELLEKELPKPVAQQSSTKSSSHNQVVLFWMGLNVLSTIGIVFTNKAVFSGKIYRYIYYI